MEFFPFIAVYHSVLPVSGPYSIFFFFFFLIKYLDFFFYDLDKQDMLAGMSAQYQCPKCVRHMYVTQLAVFVLYS